MKFATQQAHAAKDDRTVNVSFFLNARGEQLERTTEVLLERVPLPPDHDTQKILPRLSRRFHLRDTADHDQHIFQLIHRNFRIHLGLWDEEHTTEECARFRHPKVGMVMQMVLFQSMNLGFKGECRCWAREQLERLGRGTDVFPGMAFINAHAAMDRFSGDVQDKVGLVPLRHRVVPVVRQIRT
ncbi:hypothetical protein ASPACDRAFT_47031 [Aspergillus aculeatus ATCC 16872]|uniref:Uncharacterized protein n=1 Tax=Aspergillus aculeatus (strain ATCC 16872 / CBS 172.66 / WB 5094) TaxID=690307 RepID=A0A1L9WJC1_ASPA1|nr:uncharacterized protein ASPACDRAFT_47031 [Aspergillus aculeatus ATCC 16872]OJJ96261.1 hypothetical protein ASPACDRAFT_47031 [Aspergillus aculeatus ATCC 16872]